MSETPSLVEVIELGVRAALSELHHCMPATVDSFDSGKGLADVLPAFKHRPFTGGAAVELPLITNVPVVMPGTAKAWLRLPLAKGDTVLLVFSDRALGRWLEQGDQVDPDDERHNDLSDAIAIPGLFREGKAPEAKGAAGSIELVNGTGRVEITAAGLFKIANAADELLSVMDDFMDMVQGLSTTNAIVGSPCTLGPASLASIAALKVRLALLKG